MENTKKIIAALDEPFRVPVEKILKDFKTAFKVVLLNKDISLIEEATGVTVGLVKSLDHLGLSKNDVSLLVIDIKNEIVSEELMTHVTNGEFLKGKIIHN